MDLHVDVRRPQDGELRAPPPTTSAQARARVAEARARQHRRLAGTGARCNAGMDVRLVDQRVRCEEDAEVELGRAYAVGMLSPRGRHRVVRVARTIADLAGRERVGRDDILLALSLRQRTIDEAVAA
jgi:magnesium chelatase family protein